MLQLHRFVLLSEKAYRGDGVWEEDLRDIERHYFSKRGLFLIGELDGKIVAMGAIRNIGPDAAEVVRMRVHPDHQGKGYGQRMLSELELRARDMDYKELILETDAQLTKAKKLYEKNRFAFWKEEVVDDYKCVWYRKALP
jgi:GNAT superfamily N-acetyltransferase